MGRKKVKHKNKNISVSVTEEQLDFINNHPDFNISKFLQIHFQDYLNSYYALEITKSEMTNKGGNKNGKKKIK